MRNTIVRLAGLLLSATCLASAAATDLPADTLEKIRASHTISIGVREASAPFASMKDGTPDGYAVEVCKHVTDGLGKMLGFKLAVKYVPVTSANRIELLNNGTIDLECGSTTHTTERAKEVDFTYPIFITGARFAVRRDSGLMDYAGMQGIRVAVVAGSTAERLLQQLKLKSSATGKPLEVKIVADNMSGIHAVRDRAADAFCTDDVLLAGAIAQAGLGDTIHRVSRPLSVEPYAIMLRKNDANFLKAVNSLVSGYLTSAEPNKIEARWFDTPSLKYKFNIMTRELFSYPNYYPAFS